MRIICPACGCHMQADGDATAGVVACVDCGKPIDLEPLVPAATANEPGEAATVVAARVPAKPGRRSPTVPAVIALAAVAAVCAAVMTVAVVGRDRRPAASVAGPVPTVPTGGARQRLLAQKQAADALALRGELRSAYDAYGRLLAAAGETPAGDPLVAELAAGARSAQDGVFARLTAAAPPASVVRPTVPADEPGPTAAGRPAVTFFNVPPSPVVAPPSPKPSVTPLASSRPAAAPAPRPAVGVALPPAMAAADGAPAVADPPPPPAVHRYAAEDAVTDEQVGRALQRAIRGLSAHFRDGELDVLLGKHVQLGGSGDGGVAVRPDKPPAAPRQETPAAEPAGDLAGGSDLGATPAPPPGGGARPRASLVPRGDSYSGSGVDALVVYALMHAAQAVDPRHAAGPGTRPVIAPADDPFVNLALERLKSYWLDRTYHRSLRAAALAVFNRPQDRAALEDDADWLMAAHVGGAYTYTSMAGPRLAADGGGMSLLGGQMWDNSNSQYGQLGVWSAAQAGIDVPPAYWRAVAAHWSGCAQRAGTWGYNRTNGGSFTMTCGGVVSLLVARDYLEATDLPTDASAAAYSGPSPLADGGLAWLDGNTRAASSLDGYALYGLERVGLATGYKYLGGSDWYGEQARELIRTQGPDGRWRFGDREHDFVEDAYRLLFLARGRHPVLFNKLRYDTAAGPGEWTHRRQDVAHLARFATRTLERPMNWQVVNFRRNWSDWADSPVLYIAGGDQPPPLSPADVAVLRDFALAGGLIFTHADHGSRAFNEWVADLARRTFPAAPPLAPLPLTHPVYSSLFRFKAEPGQPPPPPLSGVDNGSRLLLVHSPADLAGGWQLNWTDDRATEFRLGLNVFVYAAGRSNFGNRLDSFYVPPPPAAADRQIAVARLRYDGGAWDPEPYAWVRFARAFQWETHHGLTAASVDLAKLRPGQVPAAFLTGTAAHPFTAAEAVAAHDYVAAGGVLVIDCCGGQAAFADSVRRTLVPAAFPGQALAPLAADHPVLVPSRPFAEDLRQRVKLRPYTAEVLGTSAVPVEGLRCGRGWVLFTPVDVTSGLLGTETYGVVGYDPAYATALAKNAVLWADARASPR